MNNIKKIFAALVILLLIGMPVSMAKIQLGSLGNVIDTVHNLVSEVDKLWNIFVDIPNGFTDKQYIEGSKKKYISITTGHRHFKITVTRCVQSGENVLLDMEFRNISDTDIDDIEICPWSDKTQAADNRKNMYCGSNNALTVKVANFNDYSNSSQKFSLLPDVVTRVSVKLHNVDQAATSISRIQIVTTSEQWGLTGDRNIITLKNIPISRD